MAESAICNFFHQPPPFKEYWEWPCNATGLCLPQHTWVKSICLHKLVYRVWKYTSTWSSLFWPSLIWYAADIYLSTSTISVFLCQLSLSLEPGCVLQILTMAAVLVEIKSLLWTAAVHLVIHAHFLLSPVWAQWRKPFGCLCSSAVPLKPASYTW